MNTLNQNISLQTASQLKTRARGQLLGKYRVAVLSFLTIQLINTIIFQLITPTSATYSIWNIIFFYLIYFIVFLMNGIFTIGQNFLYLNIARNQPYSFKDIWYGFKGFTDKAILIKFYMFLIGGAPAVFLFLLYFILPSKDILLWMTFMSLGFILYLAYLFYLYLNFSQAFYLILDFPDESPRELIRHSVQIMKHHKKRLAYIILSFLGLFFLSLLTFQIGLLWVKPYYNMTLANFYDNFKLQPEDNKQHTCDS